MVDYPSLPPLNALRAFGAVGRYLSFAKAAEELHVTPAAVSQQIKNLEAILGLNLFHRLGRRITLTEAGHQLLPGIENGFGEMERAVRRVRMLGQPTYISCNTVGAFAARWLVPRLERWTKAYPKIDVRISTSAELVSFEEREIDMAIRLSAGEEMGLYTELLQRETVVPMCSPALLTQTPPLRRPEDLVNFQLIHFTPAAGRINTRWADWLKIAKVETVDPERGVSLSDGTAALNAAIAGQGVVLAPKTIALIDLALGTLVIPFDIELPTDLAWRLVIPPGNLERQEIRDFRTWLLEESRGDQ